MTATSAPETASDRPRQAEAPRGGSRRGRRRPWKWMRAEQRRLDPETDAGRISELSYCTRFPRMQFPYHMYYSLFFVRASGAPESARPIDRDGCGYFYRYGDRRADDTTADIFGWMHHGPHSELGRASLERVKRMHDGVGVKWGMPNHVLLHTLACDLTLPDRFMELVGGPRFDEHERRAQLNFWRAVGDGLGIADVPETWEDMVRYVEEYERSEHYRASPEGRRLARGFVDQFCARWFPRPLHWLGRWILLSMVEDHVLEVQGFKRPPRPFVWLTRQATRLSVYLTFYVLPDPSPTYSPGELFREGHPNVPACPVTHATPS